MTQQWTRDDLPGPMWITQVVAKAVAAGSRVMPSGKVLDAVVDHLNAHHPKPDSTGVDWKSMYEREIRNRVEAVDRAARAERERDEALRKKGEAFDRAVRAERERDAAVARAEQAEREASTWRTSTESAHSDFLQAAHDRDEWKARDEYWCGDPDVFAAGAEWAVEHLRIQGLIAPAPLREEVEEAYQRGHEDGYWNGKTTDMSPAQAAAFMAPYRSRCPGCADRAEGDGSADQ